MNIEQLIKTLNNYPPDMKVVTDGYEGGYNDVEEAEVVNVQIRPDAQWYDGKYDSVWKDGEDFETVLSLPR